MVGVMNRAFLSLAVSASLLALWRPSLFSWARAHIPLLLGLIMFGMGMTLTAQDFRRILQRPGLVAIGLAAQFVLMPLLAIGLAIAFGFAEALLVGMVLVGSSPGGTASNVVAYLAGANVALSVTLTACATMLAPIFTPALVALLAGAEVDVPFWPMVLSVAQIVLLPVTCGVLLRGWLGHRLDPLLRIFPWFAMIAIVFVIAIIMALNRGTVLGFPLGLIAAVCLHNFLGLVLGYATGMLGGAGERDRRTLAIEVGMQNSGLAVALATQFFAPLSALPGALFSLWHNVSGVMLASWWRQRRVDVHDAGDHSQPPTTAPISENDTTR
jgi:BASS family bile acid:Na+ symporter